MIEDFVAFLEYYSQTPEGATNIFTNPLVRIEYDEVSVDGRAVLAYLAPFSHAIRALCYRETDMESYYNQKLIAEICRVSAAEVSAWKNEERIPGKYRWFLLLADISGRAEDAFIKKIIQPATQEEAEQVCSVFLRMIKTCYEPFCADDYLLMQSVWQGTGIEGVKGKLISVNPSFWQPIFHKD